MVKCSLCGKQLSLDEATVDHIIPKSLGGTNIPENLQLAHKACNKAKGNTLPEELKKNWLRIGNT